MFYINEISPATDPEWVELYTSETASLQNCTLYLHDTEDTNQKIIFTQDIKVENHFVVINKGEYSWTSNWLRNDGDTVRIKCADQEDKYTYSDPKDKTIGRNPDGTGEFFVLAQASEGSANAPPTPAPTPKPTETPKPTKHPPTDPPATLKPTPVPTSTPAVLSMTSKEVTPKSPLPTATTNNMPIIISETNDHVSVEPVQSPLSTGEQKETYMPYGFIGMGLIFLGAGAYPFLKKLYNKTHAPDS
jgi:hypothetical protein